MLKIKENIIISICLGLCLVFSFRIVNLCYAQEDRLLDEPEKETATLEAEESKDIFDLIIPSSWGRIKDIYKGSSDEVIIHIQDAHCHYECQNNIAKIVDNLVEEYGLTVAGIEGATGKLDTDLFATFPEDAIRAQAADYFLRDGKLSGPEALVISKGFEYPLRLFGIEDATLYNNNFDAYTASYPFKNEAKYYFSSLKRILYELKVYLYNLELNEFDMQQTAFENAKITLNEYGDFLLENMKQKHINSQDFPNFEKLQRAIKLERGIDFITAEEERTSLLTELTNILAEEDIRSLLEKGLAYRNEQVSASIYLGFVKEMALKNNLDFTKYKNLDAYIEYARNYDQIKSDELFVEMEDIAEVIRMTMYTDKNQRKVDLLVRGLKVMERLIDIKMVNRDLIFYNKHKDDLSTDGYLEFIKSQAGQFDIDAEVPTEVGYLDVYIPAWVDFYRVAGLRDEAMINNTLKMIQDNSQHLGAMVTGGFHTRELTKIMRSKDISYIVITPRITDATESPYFDRLTGKSTSLENYMKELGKATQR